MQRPELTWIETESIVFRPLLYVGGLVSMFVLAIGVFFSALIASTLVQREAYWIGLSICAVIALAGAFGLAYVCITTFRPMRVCHAVPETLPELSSEPVAEEGAVAHFWLTHKLAATDDGWEFRPTNGTAYRVRRIVWLQFSAVLTQLACFFSLFIIAAYGLIVGAVCAPLLVLLGLSVPKLVATLLRLNRYPLPLLRVSGDQSDILLYSCFPTPLLGNRLDENSSPLRIPRAHLVGVQLCPWHYAFGVEVRELKTRAVQGLLIVRSSDTSQYQRLPIMLTGDFCGAARLMGQLADGLGVPYFFYADAAGWRAEDARSFKRAPLNHGGMTC